jgi:hypothetical protein
LADVPGQQDRFATRLFDQSFSLARIFLFGEVGDRNIGAFPCERQGYGTTNAAVSAGDERFVTFQLSSSFVALLTMISGRFHLRLSARRRLCLRRVGRAFVQRFWILCLHAISTSGGEPSVVVQITGSPAACPSSF